MVTFDFGCRVLDWLRDKRKLMKTWYRSRPIFQGQKTEAVHSHIAATPKAQTLPHRMLIVSNLESLESKGQARPASHRTAKSCTSAWSKVTQWGPRTSSETYWNNDIKMHQMYPVIINDPIAFRYPYRSLKNIQSPPIIATYRKIASCGDHQGAEKEGTTQVRQQIRCRRCRRCRKLRDSLHLPAPFLEALAETCLSRPGDWQNNARLSHALVAG